MHSPNLVDTNIEKISALFPNCITETKDEHGELKKAIDFDLLKQELSQVLVEGEQERYRLDWVGKKEAILTANAPIAKTLRPCRDESINFDKTENLFIEGDNLEALKLLQENYLGKVKMIYIDPPYNTGNDFIYEDDFAESTDAFFEKSNQVDEEGNRLIANTESNGRFHSDWLSMMFSRLKLVRTLLKEDGVVFVSCDENEHSRLHQIMDETFGEDNFITDFVWAAGRKNDSKYVSISHEYIVCYVKNKNYLNDKKIIWRQKKKGLDKVYSKYQELRRKYQEDHTSITKEMKLWFKNLSDSDEAKAHAHYCHSDKKGLYFPSDISWPGGGGPKYEVIHPVTLNPVKIPSRGWVTSDPNKMQQWIAEDKVHFGENENFVPCLKSYLKEKELQTPYSVFYQDGRASSKRLRTLMEGNLFDFPKDEQILQDLIAMVSDDNDIILDCFAGSSTTAHAVMQQNADDDGKRKFIMVQIAEKVNEKSEAYKLKFKNIADISKERIRRAGKKIVEENSDKEGIQHLDIGFRVLKIDSTNMKDVYYTPDSLKQADILDLASNIKEDRTSEDLLFQVMLDWGLELSLPIERKAVAGKEVFYVAGNSLVACFEELTFDVVDEVAKDHPLRFVSAEKAIHLDHDKTNIKERFKQLSPDTEVKFL